MAPGHPGIQEASDIHHMTAAPTETRQHNAPDGHEVSQVELERRQYRVHQQIQSTITSLISTIVFVVVIVIGLKLSPGWPRVKETFFSGEYFVKSFPHVLDGLWLNIRVLLVAVVGVAILSTLIALVRTSRSPILFPLRILALIYTTVMRGVPIIVVLYLIVSEVLRAGFNDVHPSQRASARSLGLTSGQTTRLIVIPQALRKVAPALMNDFISMQKDVGLISVLGAVDAVRAAQIDVASTYNFTPYVVASLLFILMSVPFILLNDWYTERLRKRELSGGTV